MWLKTTGGSLINLEQVSCIYCDRSYINAEFVNDRQITICYLEKEDDVEAILFHISYGIRDRIPLMDIREILEKTKKKFAHFTPDPRTILHNPDGRTRT